MLEDDVTHFAIACRAQLCLLHSINSCQESGTPFCEIPYAE